MEAKKRAAAIAALCMLLLTLPKPSLQEPLSDVNCEYCYQQCYHGCKDSTPPWLCKVKCACDCAELGGSGDTFDTLLVCLDACDTDSICGLPVPLAGKTRATCLSYIDRICVLFAKE